MKTRIMQQENPKGHGVQQHLERPGFEKTFCGRKYTDNWGAIHEFDFNEDKVDDHVSCTRCREGAEKFLKESK
jgi:hypothetical protein